MQKLSVLLMWLASALTLACSPAPQEPPQLLSVQELRNPEFVVQWLNSAEAKANQENAKRFFAFGLKDKETEDWGHAVKSFSASMRYYPSPHAILEYAEASLKMLGQVRAREGFPAEQVYKDMENALGTYEVSLAANGVTKTLSLEEVERVEQYIACIKSYLLSSEPQSDCPPTVYFSSGQAEK